MPTFRLASAKRRPRLRDLRNSIEPIFRNRLHVHFTDHSIDHCDRVAHLAEELLAPLKGKAKLNDAEAFILYCGCYLHDIGMHNEKAGEIRRLARTLKKAGRTPEEMPRDEYLRLIREYHHEISADMVLDSLRNGTPPINFTLTDSDYPAEIAAICEAHCIDTGSARYHELTQKSERSTMRLGLLSAILRLADIFDEAHHRALVEQARTLQLNLESRMHWWRHYFTREVEVEPKKNRITIWFGFPASKRDDYAKIIPALQMPWMEHELAQQRAVLAENGLSWHLGGQIQESPFETLEPMPPEVENLMLQELARRKHLASQQSRVELLKHFDQARAHLLEQLHEIRAKKEAIDPIEYLRDIFRLTSDLWQIGSRLTAWTTLQSALFFATKNGRSVPAAFKVHVATELAKMQAEDRHARDSIRTLVDVANAAKELEDATLEKIEYYRFLASVELSAGYFGEGSQAAEEAIRLLGSDSRREQVKAELDEAILLEGLELNLSDGIEGKV